MKRISLEILNVRSLFVSVCILLAFSRPIFAELAPEKIPKSLSLPDNYPDSWVFVHDTHYWGSSIGKFIVLDVGAKSKQYKGVLQGALNASFTESPRRNELYVAESLYSRGTYGERTDLLVVYEKEHLSPIAEIELPGNKRAVMVSHKGLLQMTHDERFALVFNFTPGASVTVVDMDKRQVVNEVPIPGCSLIYPSGERGFSTLCANGTLASLTLSEQGEVLKETVSEHFNDIENNVLFMAPAVIDGVAYFPSALGDVQAIDMAEKTPDILPLWPLISPGERTQSWRTADGQSVAADDQGRLYVRVRKVKEDGSHLPGSSEIWVFDVNSRKRVKRLTLKKEGYAIEITRGKHPLLVALSADGIDVYEAETGRFIRTIGDFKGTLGLVHASH